MAVNCSFLFGKNQTKKYIIVLSERVELINKANA